MGQKINPVSFRTGIMIGWKSRWYAQRRSMRNYFGRPQDSQVRNGEIQVCRIPKIEIERTRDEVKVILHAAGQV